MQLPGVQQQDGSWYVLDEEFPWDVRDVKRDIFSLVPYRDTTVLFCDTCEANRVLSGLGEEEEEFLFPLAGLYHKERRLIFVFMWEEYEQMLETVLHELRHDMQYEQQEKKAFFHQEKDRHYEERWIEQDARMFARLKIQEFLDRA
ncbi:DUF3920 family protein [Ectobacillus sp. SYSU M60031]|uniref:DUF3920 family protein n=1 Tax=Ectobacillus ponti TaxID=2961894 RepID=A0AA41X636_9BACI|nr:DUF3920 family protein [Ectobacillus ponti]MCP8969629.1 DUF3920 family protein [Ectobacillus ponti]